MEKFQELFIKLNEKTVQIREALPADAPFMVNFLQKIAEETAFTFNYPGQVLVTENLAARLKSENESVHSIRLFAFCEGQIVGQIGLWRNQATHPWFQHKAEFAMMLTKEWWGTGLARELLGSMEFFALSTGVKRIEATVNTENERGVHLYKKHGYQVEGIALGYKIVNGAPKDSYYIAKLL